MTKGVHDLGDDADTFFTPYGDTPAVDRRFLIATGGALTALAGLVGGALAFAQRPAGNGVWDQSDSRDWRGVVEAKPYPALRTILDGRPMRALLSTMGKCAVDARLAPFVGRSARITGSLIRRGDYLMIAVVDGPDWIGPTDSDRAQRAELSKPQERVIADGRFHGEILDAKCWFGAMRPADGKAHKSCAALCIRGGLPPAFFLRAADGRTRAALLADPEGGPMGEDILPYVADPIAMTGRLAAVDNLIEFRAAAGSIRRL